MPITKLVLQLTQGVNLYKQSMTKSSGYVIRYKDDDLFYPLASLRKATKRFVLTIIIKGLYITVALKVMLFCQNQF